MLRLDGPVREYAWGSRTAIPGLLGKPVPAQQPQAELWLGAHPAASATAVLDGGSRPLVDLIGEDPDGTLGSENLAVYGQRLPFLFKLLAAARPLSLQAHPDAAQAAAGYQAEEAAGIPLGHPQRTYVDRSHKPELLVAVRPFDALCGFRDPSVSVRLLAALGVCELSRTLDLLSCADSGLALRGAVEALLTMPEDCRVATVDAVVVASAKRCDVDPVYALAGRLAQEYPGDPGIVVAMLLNQVRIESGQGVWTPAGTLHSYLSGFGIEIMAASDNVLRGGLTPKSLNVPELLKVLRFEVLDDPIVRPSVLSDGLVTWPVPVSDFALHAARVVPGRQVTLPGGGPRVLLCIEGEVRGRDDTGALVLARGQAAFVPASVGAVTVDGAGELYQASVG